MNYIGKKIRVSLKGEEGIASIEGMCTRTETRGNETQIYLVIHEGTYTSVSDIGFWINLNQCAEVLVVAS